MNTADKYERGFDLAGFGDMFIFFVFFMLDAYLWIDDEIRVEPILGTLILGYQALLCWYPSFYFARAFLSKMAVTSQRDKSKIHDYRKAYAVRTYGGLVY